MKESGASWFGSSDELVDANDTGIRLATTDAMRKVFAEQPSEFDPRKPLIAAKLAARDTCKPRFEAFGCAGHASRIKPAAIESMAWRYRRSMLKARLWNVDARWRKQNTTGIATRSIGLLSIRPAVALGRFPLTVDCWPSAVAMSVCRRM